MGKNILAPNPADLLISNGLKSSKDPQLFPPCRKDNKYIEEFGLRDSYGQKGHCSSGFEKENLVFWGARSRVESRMGFYAKFYV